MFCPEPVSANRYNIMIVFHHYEKVSYRKNGVFDAPLFFPLTAARRWQWQWWQREREGAEAVETQKQPLEPLQPGQTTAIDSLQLVVSEYEHAQLRAVPERAAGAEASQAIADEIKAPQPWQSDGVLPYSTCSSYFASARVGGCAIRLAIGSSKGPQAAVVEVKLLCETPV
jgi:hypothetical protein